MTPSKRCLLGALAVTVIVAHLAIDSLHSIGLFDGGHRDHDTAADTFDQRRRLKGKFQPFLSLFGGGAQNQDDSAKREKALPSPFVGAQDDADGYPYSVIIVSYHKTGHDLQMDLIDTLTSEFFMIGGPKLTEFGNKSPVRRRRHPPQTPCARIHLQTGTVSVQHAPDLFCTPDELAHILLEGGKGHSKHERGVKVVHLVRNPFSIAVSNYHYHARVPTPESWVKDQNPCEIEYDDDKISDTYADMVIPTLSKMKYDSLGVKFGDQLFTREEFDGIHNDCLSLYQTKEKLKDANFLKHLVNYDPPEGLRLATAELMIQGYDNGGDILRMANNIVKLKQAQMKVKTSLLERRGSKELQVYTMSLDDFIDNPAMSALKFFDFILEGTDAKQKHKESVAKQYEQYYLKKMKKSKHVTHGKSADSVELKEYLRRDGVFGPSLSKIALLVEAALADSRNV